MTLNPGNQPPPAEDPLIIRILDRIGLLILGIIALCFLFVLLLRDITLPDAILVIFSTTIGSVVTAMARRRDGS
jgi:hypothetical protein